MDELERASRQRDTDGNIGSRGRRVIAKTQARTAKQAFIKTMEIKQEVPRRLSGWAWTVVDCRDIKGWLEGVDPAHQSSIKIYVGRFYVRRTR